MHTDGSRQPVPAEDVLSAVGTGVWRWDSATDTVQMDGVCARLTGLGTGPMAVRDTALRACYHVEDFVAYTSVLSLSLAEGTVAEAMLRVVDAGGTVLRTVRCRAHPEDGSSLVVVGTLQEADGRAVAGVPALGIPQGSVNWQRSREAFLLDAGRALAEANSTAEVLRVAASLSMPGFSPQDQAVFVAEGSRLRMIGHHGYPRGDMRPFLDMPLDADCPAAEVARTGRAVYLPTPDSYGERYPGIWPLVEPFERSSWAFVPLVVAGRTIGAWLAAFRAPVAFSPDERFVLTTVARMLAQALSRAHLQESERELSDGLQRAMRPTHRTETAGVSVAARYVPTGGGLQVGGDWYDVIDLPSGHTALVIGDVQGHDVRAAGLMGQLRIALRAYAAEGHRPDAVLSRASRFLAGLAGTCSPGCPDDGRFATCLYLEVDPACGTVEIARAGHPNPAIRLADGTTLIRHVPGGLPLGIGPQSDYPTTRLSLDAGEVLLLCTDGLIESGGHDADTGWERLSKVFADGPADDLEALADALVTAVHGPSSHLTPGPLADRREDDLALLLLRRGAAADAHLIPPRRTVLTIAQDEPHLLRGARDEVRAVLHDWREPEQVDAAVLMVSEMVTNVLVHTDGDAALSLEVLGRRGTRRLRIEVTDRDDEMPHRRRPGELASSGRGLMLMDRLADAWGVEPRGQGKSIWCELREAREAGNRGRAA